MQEATPPRSRNEFKGKTDQMTTQERDAVHGDPVLARNAHAALEVARFDVEQAQARLLDAEQYAARQVAVLAAHDPDHPLYVAAGDPHWHVHVQSIDGGDIAAFGDVFHALDYTADRLDELVDFSSDVAASSAQQGDEHGRRDDYEMLAALYGQAVRASAKATAYANLAENARVAYRNATQPPWMRAPLYATPDEGANRAKLLTYAHSRVQAINDDGPAGLRVWECSEQQCVPSDDDDDGGTQQ